MSMKRTPEHLNVAMCACFNLRKAARSVTRFYSGILRPSGLKGTQFTILAALSVLGDITLTRFAEALVMDRTTLTRNLKPLERGGLIAIRPGHDRREKTLTITAKGRKKFERALPLWEKAQTEMVEAMGERSWRALRTGMAGALSVTNR